MIEYSRVVRDRFRFEGETITDGERLLEFTHTSKSRDLIYHIVLNVDSLEVDCPCEDFQFRVNSWDAMFRYGTEAELVGLNPNTLKRNVGVQITRHPSGLCRHTRKVQSWVRRRGIELAIESARSDEEVERLRNLLNIIKE